jgi:hypothetical protein
MCPQPACCVQNLLRKALFASPLATYFGRPHNCESVPWNKFAVLDLGKKQPVLNARILSLVGSEKGREAGQPFLCTGDQIVGREGIGEFLKGFRIRTLQEGVGALPKADVTLLQAEGEPVMLIEADTSGEGEIGTDPYEHLSPSRVLDIEVVMVDPTLPWAPFSLLRDIKGEAR